MDTVYNPLQIDILTDYALPIAIDEFTTWDLIQPTNAEVMRARGAVPLNYRDMSAAYPDLFDGGEAARKALSRENPGQTLIEEYLIGVCDGFLSIAYRRTGSRGPAARLLGVTRDYLRYRLSSPKTADSLGGSGDYAPDPRGSKPAPGVE